jgi:hypothetical protein
MDARTTLLILAAEDYTGLWDGAFSVDGGSREAREVLQTLLQEGLIAIFTNDDPITYSMVELDHDDALVALAAEENWGVPEEGMEGVLVFFLTTPKGDACVRELNWGSGIRPVGHGE